MLFPRFLLLFMKIKCARYTFWNSAFRDVGLISFSRTVWQCFICLIFTACVCSLFNAGDLSERLSLTITQGNWPWPWLSWSRYCFISFTYTSDVPSSVLSLYGGITVSLWGRGAGMWSKQLDVYVNSGTTTLYLSFAPSLVLQMGNELMFTGPYCGVLWCIW